MKEEENFVHKSNEEEIVYNLDSTQYQDLYWILFSVELNKSKFTVVISLYLMHNIYHSQTILLLQSKERQRKFFSPLFRFLFLTYLCQLKLM